jgi:hypothetical protein
MMKRKTQSKMMISVIPTISLNSLVKINSIDSKFKNNQIYINSEGIWTNWIY